MPSKIIRNGAIVDDDWTVVDGDTNPLPPGKLIVPLSVWREQAESLSQRDTIGIWLNSDESPQLIAGDLDKFGVVAINFPVFTDGRGFSYARELRQTHGYRGELRAIGAFIRDQLYYLRRCGFDAFALENTDPEQALASFNDFSETYQAAADQSDPLFRRR